MPFPKDTPELLEYVANNPVDMNFHWEPPKPRPLPKTKENERNLRAQFRRYARTEEGQKGLWGKLYYYGYRCRYCNIELVVGYNMAWDHAIPIRRGGTSLLSNFIPSCRQCNISKNQRTIFEYLNGIPLSDVLSGFRGCNPRDRVFNRRCFQKIVLPIC